MNRQLFESLFDAALERARSDASATLARNIHTPDKFIVHAPNTPQSPQVRNIVFDLIYLDSTSFFRVIDVGIAVLNPSESVGFVRVSGHRPGPFTSTWSPAELGPFKSIGLVTLPRHPVDV